MLRLLACLVVLVVALPGGATAQTEPLIELQLIDLELDSIVPGAFEPLSTAGLVVDRHTVPNHAIAYYLPPQRLELPPQEATTSPPQPSPDQSGSGDSESSGASSASSTTTIDFPPRLLVFERLYAPQGQLRPLSQLPVDAAEYLVHAMLEALLDLRLQQQDGPVDVIAQAELHFDDLPEEYRREAAVEAYADFGAHLISLANEIIRRRDDPAARENLCAAAARGIGLFVLWKGAFERQRFPGSYYSVSSSEPGALPAERHYSAHSLTPATRLQFVREILGRDWVGEPQADLLGDTCALADPK